MKNLAAGWYRKPTDRRQHGYWDGRAWVEPTAEHPGRSRTRAVRRSVQAGSGTHSQ